MASRAQQSNRVWRIGVMTDGAERDPEMQARVTVFRQALEQLGWYEGRNIRIDTRYAAGRPDLYSLPRCAAPPGSLNSFS